MVLLAALALLAASTTVLGDATARGSEAACKQFSPSNIQDVALTAATYFPANARVDITNVFSSINTTDLPAFCRVELKITTNATAGSYAITEVWLPDAWNGRTLTVGNGGLGGGVTVSDLGGVAVPQGFAGISTNTGHNSTSGDGSWGGPHNDNAIVDWGWRAVHLSVVAGKEIAKQYYRQAPKRSYYAGCSTGGRQGLKEIQIFPDSFDGIVVGSPANWMSHLQPWSVHMSLNVLPANSLCFIPQSTWDNVIGPEVMRQCDALDGLLDGIINDPRACSFRPEALTCTPGQNMSTCLTEDQIGALHRIFADYYEADQTYIFGGYQPGGEKAYATGLVGNPPFPLPQDWFRFFVLNDTQWTQDEYNASIITLGEQLNPGQSDAITPNLTAFADAPHNGKVLHYVGWADQLISPGNSVHYYETVHAFARANTSLAVDDFYRLFPVPGMNHCGVRRMLRSNADVGGQAANAFGAVMQPQPLSHDAEHNILAALLRWVEDGVAPSAIVGVKYKNDVPSDGVAFTRPICKYPSTVRFRGGDPSSAKSFFCA
ncbi:feruloyl esterase-like protein [Trametes versicolor FP-101664 SS1]|uniref:feruloyl esterase-like protein n=1 Tax=Trametes versicolor (strain FP-101664) TaxID=717944 RepID=UPI0004623AE8|nr:feruloyl esterase-like protein [Trametes versicolor FP-101664 SS1]EIW55233.1 feruloyl esterase-like protein [Trametes versicolor FP-101664 SS1]